MLKGLSERRLAENELMFRQANEKIQKDIKQLQAMAAKEDNPKLYKHEGQLHFYCECSDENCRQRIVISSDKYEGLHQNRSQFVVIPGHEVKQIERVLLNTPKYAVVEKWIKPPAVGKRLHKTDIDND